MSSPDLLTVYAERLYAANASIDLEAAVTAYVTEISLSPADTFGIYPVLLGTGHALGVTITYADSAVYQQARAERLVRQAAHRDQVMAQRREQVWWRRARRRLRALRG